MVDYPIHVPRSPYRGRDPEKVRQAAEFNADAALLEKYINKQAKQNRQTRFLYSLIARELEMDVERVRRILSGVDYGTNGLAINAATL